MGGRVGRFFTSFICGISQDDYIKRYLEDPDLPFITTIKIGLRYTITPKLILQLQARKDHLGIKSFKKL